MRRFINQFLVAMACLILVGCNQGASPDVESTSDDGASPVAGPAAAEKNDRVAATSAMDFKASADTATVRSKSFDASTDSSLGDELARIDAKTSAPGNGMNRPRAGTLTAGSLDDHKHYDDFVEYVRNALQVGQVLKYAQQLQHRRALIEVQDADGRPISDAQVAVFAQADQQLQSKYPTESDSESVITLTTGSDGRTLFLPQLDGSLTINVTEFELEITAAGEITRHTVSMNQTPWVVKLESGVAQLPQQLDLALIIDTTGSMTDELAYLKVEIDSIAQKVKSLFPNVDQRFAVVFYRDNGDAYVTRAYDFTSSLSEFRSTLAGQSARGGGDHPEAMDVALERTTQLSWRKGDTARVAFIVGDAPPHVEGYDSTFKSINKLRAQGVSLFPIAASGSDDRAEFILRTASFLTMGRYLFLTDHSGVGNSHATPDAPRYEVERLDQLMVRMIASELAGEEVLAQDVIAIERRNAEASTEQRSQEQQTPPNVQSSQTQVAPHEQIAVPALETTLSATPLGAQTTEETIRWVLVACCGLALVLIQTGHGKAKAQSC